MKKEEVKELLYTLLYLIIYLGVFLFLIPHTLLHFFQKWNLPNPVFFAFGAIFPILFIINKIGLKRKQKRIVKDAEKLNDKVELNFSPDIRNLFNTYFYEMKHKKIDNISLEIILSKYTVLYVNMNDLRISDLECDIFYPRDADFSSGEPNFSQVDMFDKSVIRPKSQRTVENMAFVYDSVRTLGPIHHFSVRKGKLRFDLFGNYDELSLKNWKIFLELAEKYHEFLKDNGYYKTMPL